MKNLKDLNLSKYSVTSDGRVYSLRSSRFLKNYEGGDGYYKLSLTDDDGKIRYWRVNRIVAMAFCDGYSEALVVNHKDGNKLNNHYSNLEWVTIQENVRHSLENSLQTSICGKEIISIDKVHTICKLLEDGCRKKDISVVADVTMRTVTEIQNKTYWKWISDEYDFSYIKKVFRLSLEKVLVVCERLQAGEVPYVIAKDLKLTPGVVYNIKHRKNYRDISKNFHW